MKETKEEKRLLGLFRKLESEKTRDDLIFQAEAAIRVQEAVKKDYGLASPDAPLFTGAARPAV
jgi:hypothetical protein